jgi:mycothiol synthase
MTLADVPGAQRVLDDAESVDCGEPRRHETRLAVEVRDPGFDLNRNVWVATAPDGTVAAVGWVWRARESAETTADHYVHPQHRGLGLGDALLDAIEARAVELAAASASGARHSLVVWSEDRDVVRLESLLRRGFAKVREYFEMRIDLAAEPVAPDLPAGITVLGLRVGRDEHAVHAADVEAFAEHFLYEPRGFEEWRIHHIDRPDFDPSLWLVAWDGDELVGYACAFVADDGAIVGDLAVRRPWRGRGLGLALLVRELRALWARGERVTRLYVDAQNTTGAVRLYERAGMHVARHFDVYEKPLP